MRKFGNLELIRAKFVDFSREDNKANAMHIEAVQSKSEREKKTELGKYTCRLAQSTQNYKSFDFIPHNNFSCGHATL